MIKKIGLTLLLALIALICWVLFRTFSFSSQQMVVEPHFRKSVNEQVIQRLQAAIQLPTISYDEPGRFDTAAFQGFVDLLAASYPLCDSLLDRTLLNEYGLLYHWTGQQHEKEPVVLMAHYDVVPVEPGTESQWEQPPFSGKVDDTYIWGRGSIDNKSTIIALMESAEQLLQEGFEPERPIYFLFGFDEEIGGKKGAVAGIEHLKSKGVSPILVLDEGQVITKGLIPGMDGPVALIGTAQKGYLSLKLAVNAEGGHSSMPASENALTILTRAVNRLSDQPFDAELCPPVQAFLGRLGPEMPFLNRMAFANLWLFEGMVKSQYAKSGAGNATIRTTMAPTMIDAGVKENVVPTEANATVNFRILPGYTRDDIIAAVEQKINDERVTLTTLPFGHDPTNSGATDTPGFRVIEKSLRQTYPGTLVAPSLVLATTDSRHFASLTNNIYNHQPVPLTSEDLSRIHGINERLAVEDLLSMVRFYDTLLQNCNDLDEF